MKRKELYCKSFVLISNANFSFRFGGELFANHAAKTSRVVVPMFPLVLSRCRNREDNVITD